MARLITFPLGFFKALSGNEAAGCTLMLVPNTKATSDFLECAIASPISLSGIFSVKCTIVSFNGPPQKSQLRPVKWVQRSVREVKVS